MKASVYHTVTPVIVCVKDLNKKVVVSFLLTPPPPIFCRKFTAEFRSLEWSVEEMKLLEFLLEDSIPGPSHFANCISIENWLKIGTDWHSLLVKQSTSVTFVVTFLL
jgi:hypothetical protein